MNKKAIITIAEKNRIINRICQTIKENDVFLLLGHKDPDTDCIASLVAYALLLGKFQKDVTIYLARPPMVNFNYLLAICKYNGISIVYGKLKRNDYTVVTVLDTPKPEMIEMDDEIAALIKKPALRLIEIDHHLGADSLYAGSPEYALVNDASSTCELIGYLLYKIAPRKEYAGIDFFSRNLSLSILTGIVGDSQMGKYLKTRKERFFYRAFTEIFDRLLMEKTIKNSKNISSMDAIFDVIKNFSVQERRCFEAFAALQNTQQALHYACLDQKQSAEFFDAYGEELMINISKSVADTLAEHSGKLGMAAYYDNPALSDFVQFRLRRSAAFTQTDLRDVLSGLEIGNGGGHPGAIGFRVKKADITDIGEYISDLVRRVERLAGIQ